MFVGPAATQKLVVKFDGEICGGVLVENASDDFPSKRSSNISFQTSPEVRHQFRRKLRQIHSGNRCCLIFAILKTIRFDTPLGFADALGFVFPSLRFRSLKLLRTA